VLLDGIQAGCNSPSDRYDNSPGKSKLIGKLQDQNIRSPIRDELMNILLEIGEHADTDGMAVTHELQAGALAQGAEKGKPVVKLCSSKTASINAGDSLVRSKGSSLSREDTLWWQTRLSFHHQPHLWQWLPVRQLTPRPACMQCCRTESLQATQALPMSWLT
jgi:hypothetical protein